jgi:NADH-quinone oxidoreductase subunit G
MQPSTFELTDFTSKFSGNVIEICPVGALTNSEYRFRARPWDLETRPAICTVCSNGCNVWFDYRVNKQVRINGRTNEAVNEEWTCDKGKFGHEFYNSDKRLTKPLVRRGDVLAQASWAEAYDEIIKAFGTKKGALLGGGENSNEDLFMAKKMFKEQFGSDLIDYRFQAHSPSKSEMASLKLKQKPIASYESAKTILIFGTSLADEEAILFLRVRKAWSLHGVRVIVASERATEADAFAEAALRFSAGGELALAEALAGKGDGAPGGAQADVLKRAREALGSGSAAIIATQSIYENPDGQKILAELAGLGELSVYGLHTNDQGAQDLGLTSDGAASGIFKGCEGGSIEALWLLGADPFALQSDRELVRRAIENIEFLVVQAHSENEAFHYASVVLPMCAPAEMEGTYTNLERRVQRMDQILPTKGEAKPAWRVFSEIALRVSGDRPFFSPDEIMAEIVREHPAFAGVDYATLNGSEGQMLQTATEPVSV